MENDKQLMNSATPLVKSWWASRWARSLTGVMDAARLNRARTYVRRGRVQDLDLQVGLILASVQDSAPVAYRVRIEVKTLSEDEWDRVVNMLADRASYAAQLLNGQMPHEVEDAFQSAGVSLFPKPARGITTSCTCSEVNKPCQHAAAVFLFVGEMLDRDPFLIFSLRGRSRAQIMSALRQQRALMTHLEDLAPDERSRMGAEDAQLTERIDDFWHLDREVRDLQLHVQPPEVDLEILKRLGDPAFAEDEGLSTHLALVYHRVSLKALEVAYRESHASSEVPDSEE